MTDGQVATECPRTRFCLYNKKETAWMANVSSWDGGGAGDQSRVVGKWNKLGRRFTVRQDGDAEQTGQHRRGFRTLCAQPEI